MKLSELAELKKILTYHDIKISRESTGHQLKNLVDVIVRKYKDDDAKAINDVLSNQYQILSASFQSLELIVNKVIADIDTAIEEKSKSLLALSDEYYKTEQTKTTSEILDLHGSPHYYNTDRFFSRILKYGDWKYPALVIHPGRETFIESMIDNDPLYIVDQSYDLLEPAVAKFNETYQRRIRKYVVDEAGEDDILAALPDLQFGICVVYHYFNFRPFAIIQKYLGEIYKKLRPGGVVIFTFNSLDDDMAAELTEESKCCITSVKDLKDEIEKLGYEILFQKNYYPGPGTWMELKKPGALTSIRGGQTLAKIVSK
jgi:SAM-dependent methyltransferase